VKITIVPPALMRDTFSAGIACLMIYARGLSARGHEVRVLPLGLGYDPSWIQLPPGTVVENAPAPVDALRSLSRLPSTTGPATLRPGG